MIVDWNVLATLRTREKRSLRTWETRAMTKHLKQFGDFQWTKFLGVLVGRVQDHEAFFTQLLLWEEDHPGSLDPLARVVPIDTTFSFTVDTFAQRLQGAVMDYVPKIGPGSFYVRLERRGHAGEIHSTQMEQETDHIIQQACREKGWEGKVDFKDPDLIIVAETLDDVCGIGSVSKDLRSRFPFIRVP